MEAKKRSPIALIKEAELLASPPEVVYKWLENRAIAEDSELPYCRYDGEIEKSLFTRNEPLILLGLGRFTLSGEIANKLFTGNHGLGRKMNFGGGWDNDSNTGYASALRLAVLSNEAIAAKHSSLLEYVFGENKTALLEWISQAETNEIYTLFNNPFMGDDFLTNFLEGKDIWQAMSEELRVEAIKILSGNKRMCRSFDGSIYDGQGWCDYTKVFSAAWKLSETLPTTPVWADALARLYEKLSREGYGIEPLKVAKRWLNAKDPTAGYGYLGHYGSIRYSLARLALEKDPGGKGVRSTLISSDDDAFRAAAYSSVAMSPEEIVTGFKWNWEVMVSYAYENEKVWYNKKSRQALYDCSESDEYKDKGDEWQNPSRAFYDYEKLMKEKHPQWFEDDEDTPNMPATKADIQRILEEIEKSQTSIESISSTLTQFGKRIENMIDVLWSTVNTVTMRLWLASWLFLGLFIATVWKLLF